MKIEIIYYSQTGNTELIAKAIHAEASVQHSADLINIDNFKRTSLADYQLIFIGSPCHAGTLSAPVRDLITQLPKYATFHLAGFITHASPAYNKNDYETCMTHLASICANKNIPYHGCFECQGRLAPPLHELVRKSKKTGEDEWKRMMESIEGRPSADDEQNARLFARGVISGPGLK